MINKPPPFKDLNIRIPIIIPTNGRGFINQGSGLAANPVKARDLQESRRMVHEAVTVLKKAPPRRVQVIIILNHKLNYQTVILRV